MNKSFNATTLRVTPAQALLQLQHQSNHYKKIINPRKITSHQSSRQQDKIKTYSSCIDNKFEKQKRESIQRQNQRILKDCVQIYKTRGILQIAEDQFWTAQNSPKKTLVNSHKAKQRLDKLKKQNKIFRQKIQKLKPLVGDKQHWKRHQSFTNELVNKLRNKSVSKVYNNQTIVRIAINSEKQKVNYLTLFKTLNFQGKQSYSKEKSRNNQVKTAREGKKKRRKLVKKQQYSQITNLQNLNQNQKNKFLPVIEMQEVGKNI